MMQGIKAEKGSPNTELEARAIGLHLLIFGTIMTLWMEKESRPRRRGNDFAFGVTTLSGNAGMFAKVHRKEFVSSRAPLSDAEFLSRLNVRPELHRFVCAAREALARACRVAATSLYPEDSPKSVLKLMTFDWDDTALSMELEKILGVNIDEKVPMFVERRFFWWFKEAGPQTIGEWCVRVAEFLSVEMW